MSHVFISYNQADADFAAVLMMRLEKQGFDTGIDKGRLRPGADWSEEIDKGIITAVAMVLVISPDSRTSEYVTYEWSFALGAGVPVVPVLLRQTEIHPRLRRLQYLDFRGNVRPWEELIQELVSLHSEGATRWKIPRNAPQYVQRAIFDLDSGNGTDRGAAIQTLANSDDEIARPALQHALTHSLRDVRGGVAVALTKLHDPMVITETGIRALKDALSLDDDRRMDARTKVQKIGRAAFDILVDASRSEREPSRYQALQLLSATGGQAAVEILLQFVNSSNKYAVYHAIGQRRVEGQGGRAIDCASDGVRGISGGG